jgi:hypothetical protein
MESKPRLVEIVGDEATVFIEHQIELDYPYMIVKNGHVWCDADELRVWRQARGDEK